MQAKRWAALSVPVVAIIGGLLSPLLSEAIRPDAQDFEVRVLAFSVASSIMYIGCALVFLLGLANFTAKLKIAYGVFCSALILFALAELQVPIGALIGQADNAWLSGGGVLLPILVAISGMYAGVKLTANLYGVKGPWGRPWLVAIMAIIASTLGYMLPVGSVLTTEEAAKGSNAIMAMILVLFASCALLLWHIKAKATKTYAKAMFWFWLAMLSFVAVTIVTMSVITTVGTAHPFMQSGGTICIQSLLALFVLKAAYEFNVIGSLPLRDVPRNGVDVSAPASVNIVDIVVAASQRASNVTAIDPWLDNLRQVTARAVPGQPLSPADQVLLINTYKEIERYLVEVEPVRRYSKDELRALIRKELQITGPVFFDTL
jgi:hypothetical protein